jgi:3-oxoacyl-[acyl-carrier protein] reductase
MTQPNAPDFDGRVAVITGGASGIGHATAHRLATGGAAVAVLDLDGATAEAVAAELGERAISVGVDVSDAGAVNAAVSDVEQRLGRIDALVCSAGTAGDSLHTVDVSDSEWRRVFGVNSDGVFYCNRAVLPGMVARGYGRIVNVASIAGKEGNPMAAAYSASKASVIGMTKSIGKDVADTGVLVNCIAPAVIRTPILAQMSEEHIQYMLARIPLARLGEAAEVAELIAFLASERLSFSTGATFDISGGRATY